MKKILFICAAAFILAFTGCGKEETDETPGTDSTFGAEKGIAAGIADFSEDEPEISIKNIITYVGEEIDYSSGIEVSNTEKYEDFQMWVDASAVDIYTVGSYEAVYKFIYGDNEKEVKVVVSVIENTAEADEPSGDSVAYANGNNGSSNADNNSSSDDGSNSGAGSSSGSGSGENSNDGSNADSNGGSSNGSSSGSSNVGSSSGSSNGSSAGGNNSSSNSGSSNVSNSGGSTNSSSNSGQSSTEQTTTARRQIVTSTGVSNTKSYSLGYMNIELLSGTTVKIKCTSSKYIVSTRTDTSQTTKNGVTYNVYKLIIKYNTGAEQVLETYEEKINN